MSQTQLDAFCTGGSSPPSSACDTVSTATPSISGAKRGIVPKRRFQKGTFVKRGDNWVGMWRVDTLQPDGTTKREQRSQTFIGLSERAARAAFQPILDAVNAPVPINERRRLAAVNSPLVVLQCSVGPTPAVFSNGAWNHTFPNMVLFDDRFVDENVYSGLNVEPGHRQNLHELVLGAQGVALNLRLQELVARIEDHNAELRARANAILAVTRGVYTAEEFCGLPGFDDLEDQIRATAQSLAAAQEQGIIRNAPGFDTLELPGFDVEQIRATLARDLPVLDAAAATRVQEHIRQIGRGGEAWVQNGMQRIIHTAAGNETCPFCAQDLAHSNTVGQYRLYFGEEYARHRQGIADVLAELTARHSEEIPARLERALRIATERRGFWLRYCDVPDIALDTEPLIRDWRTSRDGLVASLEAKQSAPLEQIQIPDDARAANEGYAASLRAVQDLNQRLREVNAVIQTVKEEAAVGDPQALEERLERLRVTRTRHTAEATGLCEEYLTAKAAKAETERLRDETKEQLERHRETAFPAYQGSINEYLRRFNVGFRIDRVAPVDTRGGPACNYDVVINNTSIPVAGGVEGQAEPAFRSTLSSGDRSTLALAFFFSSLDRDPNLADKVIVIDDPISSLDEHRSFTTVQELRRLGLKGAQIIILSHDKPFLCRVWQGIDQAICTPIKIVRDAVGSTIMPWEVSHDSITEHDRNHALLRSYLQNGPGNNSQHVAVALRPVLEGFFRVAYPQHFPPEPRILGRFMAECRRRSGTPDEILDAGDVRELGEIVEYANLFHHETNPAWEAVVVNDAELQGFVRRILRFATR